MALRLADRWFRAWGALTVLALAVTASMLALRAEAWRVPFVAAHLAALLALAPLSVALVASVYAGYLRAGRGVLGAAGATLAHDRVVTALVLLALASAAGSLSQFEGGVRWLRTAANLVTVSVVVALVGRYLRGR